MGPTDTIPPEAQALAEAQAEKDREFLDALRKKQVSEVILDEAATAESVADAVAVAQRQPMNRAERRAQVKQYAAILAFGNKQTPVVNPTIIPKSARRLRKRSKHAH
jgi:hypothetical protein